jgi:hypothetical protein
MANEEKFADDTGCNEDSGNDGPAKEMAQN